MSIMSRAATATAEKDLGVTRLEDELNGMFAAGYRLAHIFEQSGNTIMVYERVA